MSDVPPNSVGCSASRTGVPSANAATLFPTDQVVMNAPQYGRYSTYEVSLNKRYGNRWSGSMGYGFTQQENFPENYPLSPNQPGVQHRSTWNFKATGSYDAGWGIRLSPVVRHQSGVNYARTLTIATPAGSGLVASGLAYAEPADSNREDNIWVFDVRTEKTLNLGSRVRIRAYLDLINITNSHASETISRATCLSYLKPSAILAPMTARVGFRFIF